MQCDEMSKACVHEVSEKEKNGNKGKEHSECHQKGILQTYTMTLKHNRIYMNLEKNKYKENHPVIYQSLNWYILEDVLDASRDSDIIFKAVTVRLITYS